MNEDITNEWGGVSLSGCEWVVPDIVSCGQMNAQHHCTMKLECSSDQSGRCKFDSCSHEDNISQFDTPFDLDCDDRQCRVFVDESKRANVATPRDSQDAHGTTFSE